MAYGGGVWSVQNKILPGSYINFTSLKKADATLSDRGIAAVPFSLNWGEENKIFPVTAEDFIENSLSIFGYAYDAPELIYLREVFVHATKVLCYRFGNGSTKASNTYATAKFGGTRGNDIKISITANVDDESAFDVNTYIGTKLIDTQTVKNAGELKSNDFVDFISTASLEIVAGVPLSGGANIESVTGEDHQAFLKKLENFTFNSLCCPAKDETTMALYASYAKRMRREVGVKFQLVAYKLAGDDETVINVENSASHDSITVDEQAVVYWVTGAQAGCAVNKSLTNTVYNGELKIDCDYTQYELKQAILSGKFVFHEISGTPVVLEDINSLVTVTEEKNESFKSNKIIRACDQLGNDVAVLFNTKYVGKVNNDASGRASLWNDIVKYLQEYERLHVIENFNPDIVSVDIGDDKKAVLLTLYGIEFVDAMTKLYMSNVIS